MDDNFRVILWQVVDSFQRLDVRFSSGLEWERDRAERLKANPPPSDEMEYLADLNELKYWDRHMEFHLSTLSVEAKDTSSLEYQLGLISGIADRLDHYVPLLLKYLRAFQQPPVAAIVGIEERHQLLTNFLNSGESKIEIWKRSHGFWDGLQVRQRRPKQKWDRDVVDSNINVDSQATKAQETIMPAFLDWRKYSSAKATLVAMTSVTLLLGAFLQASAFWQSPLPRKGGSLRDPDFLSALQNFFMQMLSLYFAIIPAIQNIRIGRQYAWWTWSFAYLSLITSIASVAIYTTSPDINSVLVFIAASLQAFVILQLLLAISDLEKQVSAKPQEQKSV